MKPVYIDITDIRESELSAVAALAETAADLRLAVYSAKERAYRLIDSQRFISSTDRLHGDITEFSTDTLLLPEEFEENSVFLELCSSWRSLPNRSWLLPKLKNRCIRIVTVIRSLDLIRRPQNADSGELLRFMEYLPAQLRYADELIVPTEEVKADLELLFAQLDLTPKPVRTADLTSGAELMKIAYGTASPDTFAHKPVKQVVFLSARPEPILATLPYIEEFMPFITELVVCCPDFMADFMKQRYRGRLRLTTITDGEVLAGRTLPPDHSTRNFFLRCLAMEQPAIDDEFIMCDDDYRPLRPLTEEIFFKDGKYRGYHFSDIASWKYKITALFSYDYCHFRTLGFLKAHGYPTFQYSSHMPQIINKSWYLEMIGKYPEIITKGYDEWSTYFNYISAEHPEHFRPCDHVTLSWVKAGSDPKGAVQPDYAFENFYIEDYTGTGVFSGFSTEFSDRSTVMAENEKKITISRRFNEMYADPEQNSREYAATHSSLPTIAVYCGRNAAELELGMPEFIPMSRGKKNIVEIGISRAERTEANFSQIVVELTVTGREGRVYAFNMLIAQQQLEYGRVVLDLTEYIPEGEELSLRARTWTTMTLADRSATIPIKLI